MSAVDDRPLAMKPGGVLAASVITQTTISGLFQGLPSLGPALQTSLGLSAAAVGVIIGLFSVAASTVVIFWGRLLDRTTDRFVAVVGLAGGAVFLVIAALGARSTSQAVTIAALICAGAFVVAPSIAITSGMARAFKGTRRFGLAFGIRQAAVPLGGVIASATLPVIAYTRGLSLPFVILAIAMAVCAVVVLFVLRGEERPTRPAQRPSAEWYRIVPLLTSCALYVFAQIGLLALLTLFLFNEQGWDPPAAARMYAVVMAAAIFTRIGVGHLADRLESGGLLIYRANGIITAALLVAAALAAHTAAVVPLVVLASISGMTGNPLMYALTVQAVPPERIGATQGVMTATIFLGGGIAPIIIAPLVAATSWSLGWVVLACACIAGAIIARTRQSR